MITSLKNYQSIQDIPLRESLHLVELSETEAWENYYLCSPDEFSQAYRVVAKRIGSVSVTMIPKLDWSFFNRIVGLGVSEPATETMLDDAISILKDAGCNNFMAQISPMSQPYQLPTWLEKRGFKLGRNWAKVYRGNELPIDVPTELRVETIGIECADMFADIALSAFEMPAELRPLVKGPIGKQGWHHYLAFDGDQPVSAGAMFVSGEIAWLGFGSTLVTHRNRGGQGAVFARRINDGLALGCKLFVTETGEDTLESPNPSYHNMMRHGFKLAYLRPNYIYKAIA